MASSALFLASNSSLRLCIARFIDTVLEGFSTYLSAIEAYFAKLFYKAALNLSIGGCDYCSFKYYLSNVFELVLVKLGLLGLVT